jgi:hypothetical protein
VSVLRADNTVERRPDVVIGLIYDELIKGHRPSTSIKG